MLYQKNAKFQERIIKAQEKKIEKQQEEIWRLIDWVIERNEFCRTNHRRTKASVKKISKVSKEMD